MPLQSNQPEGIEPLEFRQIIIIPAGSAAKIAAVTKAVVATFVLLSPAVAVVAVAAPNAGAASDVMSVLAPDAAAPIPVLAAAPVAPPVPPLATESGAVPSRNVCKPVANDARTSAMIERIPLLTFAAGQPSAMLSPSTVTFEAAVVDQSKSEGIGFSYKKATFAWAAWVWYGCEMADTGTIAAITAAQGALIAAWPSIHRFIALRLEKLAQGRESRPGSFGDKPSSIAYSTGRLIALSQSKLIEQFQRLRKIKRAK